MSRRAGRIATSLGVGVAALSMVVAIGPAGHGAATLKPAVAVGHPTAPADTLDPARLTQANRLLFGLTIPNLPTGNPASMQALRTREAQLHHQATIVSYFQSWSSPFDPLAATNVWKQGALPMISWDPYNPRHIAPVGQVEHNKSEPYEKNWTLAKILSGRYDSYIRATAKAMAALPFPIALRVAHEQNGDWFPWGIYLHQRNGRLVNTAAQFREMWRHVWRIFQAEHATNVLFVWSPNAPSRAHPSLGSTYPGNKYVDWVAVSAYMYSSTSWGYIGGALRALHQTAPTKPAFIAETGVGEPTHDKARGIAHILSHVLKQPDFGGWVYLDSNVGRTDWRFETSPRALATLRRGLKNKRYFAALPSRTADPALS